MSCRLRSRLPSLPYVSYRMISIFADHAPVDAVSQQRDQLSSPPPKMRSPNSLSPQQQAMKVHPAPAPRDGDLPEELGAYRRGPSVGSIV